MLFSVTTCSSAHSEDQNGNIMLSGSSGIIESPNFPFSYPTSIKCIWRIKLSSNTSIVNISFTSFELQSGFDSGCSTYDDYLEMFDGYNVSDGVSLGRFCGSKALPHIYTRGNMLTIVFNSNSYATEKDFSAAYSSVSNSGMLKFCSANCKRIALVRIRLESFNTLHFNFS